MTQFCFLVEIAYNKYNFEFFGGDLSQLAYVSMFVKEVLRLYPPVFTVARKTAKQIRFPRGFGEDQYCLNETPVI